MTTIVVWLIIVEMRTVQVALKWMRIGNILPLPLFSAPLRPGVFLALPTLAALRAVWEFFSERIRFEPWQGGEPVPVEVELEIPEAPVPVGDKLDE